MKNEIRAAETVEQSVNSEDLKKCGGVKGKGGCGQLLPPDSFGSNKSKPSGKSDRCLTCESKRITQYRNDNPEYQAKGAVYADRFREKNPGRNLANVVRYRYGLTVEERAKLVADQGNACARCRTPFEESTGLPCMDHDHDCSNGCTGERSCGLCLRGALCIRCNARLSRKFCRGHRHTDGYLVRYAVRRALLDQDVDSALSALLSAVSSDHLEDAETRERAIELGAILATENHAVLLEQLAA